MRQNGNFSSRKHETFFPKLICASSDESADILYASGFHAPDEFLYFETEQRRGIVVSPLEYSRACAEAKEGVEVIDRSALMRECGTDRPFLPFFSRRLGVPRWCVPERFPLKTAIELSDAGIEVICVKAPFFPARECKTREEIAAIAKSVRATEEMMRLLHAMLAESKVNAQGCLELAGQVVTCEFLRAEIEGNFKRMGYTASRTILACGVQSAAPHNSASGRRRGAFLRQKTNTFSVRADSAKTAAKNPDAATAIPPRSNAETDKQPNTAHSRNGNIGSANELCLSPSARRERNIPKFSGLPYSRANLLQLHDFQFGKQVRAGIEFQLSHRALEGFV